MKSYAMLSEETYRAVAEAAAQAGLPLVGHIPELVTLETAIEAGHDVMEHLALLSG